MLLLLLVSAGIVVGLALLHGKGKKSLAAASKATKWSTTSTLSTDAQNNEAGEAAKPEPLGSSVLIH